MGPEDNKMLESLLKDDLTFYVWTDKEYSILDSELPLSFVLRYKPKMGSYIGLITSEILSLVSSLRYERNSTLVRLQKDLSYYLNFKK